VRVLFDQGTPAPLQNLVGRKLAIVVLSTTSWPRIRTAGSRLTEAVGNAARGSYVEVSIE
jgi:hypothetical protein